MTLRHLKIFVAVCEYGSITHAAEHLFLAQPAVSVAISELEKYYGVPLFLSLIHIFKLINSGINKPDKMNLNKKKSLNKELFSIMEKLTGKISLPSYKEILSHSSDYNSDPIYNAKAYLEFGVELEEPFVHCISNIEKTTSEINSSVKKFAKQLKNVPKKNTPKVDNLSLIHISIQIRPLIQIVGNLILLEMMASC